MFITTFLPQQQPQPEKEIGETKKKVKKKMEKSDDHHKTSNGVSGGTATEKWEDGSTGIRTAETMLRLAPVGLCIAALVIMLQDSQDNEFGSISYSNLSAFRYLLHTYKFY